jgi:hypothetical protein
MLRFRHAFLLSGTSMCSLTALETMWQLPDKVNSSATHCAQHAP